jgi:SAM-dependent methyltransferase
MNREEKEAGKKYDFVAEHFHNWRTKLHPKGWIYNEHLEMPATLKLLGNVKGKKILEVGCGSGIYIKLLARKGALVKGFDISNEMLSIAKRENPSLELKQGSFYAIPFKEKFDIAFASLVIGYGNNWNKIFKEISRILKTGGHFIFSIGNPVTEISERVMIRGKRIKYRGIPLRAITDYFNEKKIYSIWKNILKDEKYKDIRMHSYHKTYETIIKTIIKNGFEIEDYADCFPTKESKKLFPKEYRVLSRIPYFCVWKVKKKKD